MAKSDDIAAIVLKSEERIDSQERAIAIHHERIGMLEKATANMSLIPQTVAGLAQKVESLDTSMKREVDGLREQHKSHKLDTEQKMKDGFTKIGEKVDGLVLRSATDSATQNGWFQVLQVIGAGLVGLALILEACKSLIH